MEGKTSLTFVQEQQFIKTHFALSPHSCVTYSQRTIFL